MTPGARGDGPGRNGAPAPRRVGPPVLPLACFIPGLPAPQGSKRHVGNGVMIEANPRLRPWRDTVATRVHQAMVRVEHPRFARGTPVHVNVEFRMPRGVSVTRALPSVPPDVDKLLRAVLDGLTTGGLLADDGQVTTVLVRKVYAGHGKAAGALLSVREDL